MIREPMLAAKLRFDQLGKLRYPLLCTPKLDGIRALMIDGQLLTRKFKPIPNVYIRKTLENFLPNGFDGEIMLRDESKKLHAINSAVMSRKGEPDFVFYVFDWVGLRHSRTYQERVHAYMEWVGEQSATAPVEAVHTTVIHSEEQLLDYEKETLSLGYEGVILRDSKGVYKWGRSTLKQHGMMKLKRVEDMEAEVVGFVERMHNANELEKDAFGRAKRSKKKAGMVGTDSLGAFIVENEKGQRYEIGTGYTEEQRVDFWKRRNKLIGALITHTYTPYGEKDAPRCAAFKSFRSRDDV